LSSQGLRLVIGLADFGNVGKEGEIVAKEDSLGD
jgi:hypothetical protein